MPLPLRRASLPLLLLFVGCLVSANNRFDEPSTVQSTEIIVPAGYQGPVVVWYRRLDGAIAEVRGRHTVYRVPASGLLEVRLAKQQQAEASDLQLVRAGSGDTIPVVGNCRVHRSRVRGTAAASVAACWPPAYAGGRRAPGDSVFYDAMVLADSAHLAEAYNAMARLVTERLFGRADGSFRWVEPRAVP